MTRTRRVRGTTRFISQTTAVVISIGCLAAACDVGLGPGSDGGIEYLVERFEVVEEDHEWAPFPIAYLDVELAMVNERSDSVYLEYGDCALELEGVSASEGSEPRVWRSGHRKTWPHGTRYSCLLYLAEARLGPGDTIRPRELDVRFELAEILADSLPAGPYDFDAIVGIGDGARLKLGEIHLPTSRYPIPERVTYRDGFRYEVDLDADDAGERGEATAVLEVEFAAPSGVRVLERTFSETCPARILAFQDSLDAITIPQPEPVWRWPSSCGPAEMTVRLGPGETRTFEEQIDFEAVVDRGATPGRYFLVAVIDVDDRPLRVTLDELEVTR